MGDRGQKTHPCSGQRPKTPRFVPHGILCLTPLGEGSPPSAHGWGCRQGSARSDPQGTLVPGTVGHCQHPPPPAPPTQSSDVTCARCYSRARNLHVEVPVTGQALIRGQHWPKVGRKGLGELLGGCSTAALQAAGWSWAHLCRSHSICRQNHRLWSLDSPAFPSMVPPWWLMRGEGHRHLCCPASP